MRAAARGPGARPPCDAPAALTRPGAVRRPAARRRPACGAVAPARAPGYGDGVRELDVVGCPGRDALEPAHRAAARARRRPLPADLGRRAGGERDRARPAGRRPAAAADARPAAERHRGARPPARGGPDRRDQGQRLPRRAASSTAGSRSGSRSSDAIALALRTGSRIVGADEVLEAGGVAVPTRTRTRTRWRSSASSSTRSRRRTSARRPRARQSPS